MAEGTMTCDHCKRANQHVLFQAKVAVKSGAMGGMRLQGEEWCASCVATSFPAGIYAEAEA